MCFLRRVVELDTDRDREKPWRGRVWRMATLFTKASSGVSPLPTILAEGVAVLRQCCRREMREEEMGVE